LSDSPGLVPPALPWWAMPLVLWRTCPRVTYFPPITSGTHCGSSHSSTCTATETAACQAWKHRAVTGCHWGPLQHMEGMQHAVWPSAAVGQCLENRSKECKPSGTLLSTVCVCVCVLATQHGRNRGTSSAPTDASKTTFDLSNCVNPFLGAGAHPASVTLESATTSPPQDDSSQQLHLSKMTHHNSKMTHHNNFISAR